MMSNKRIKIIGAGPTGSLLAIALANQDFKVDLYDFLSAEEIINRNKTYALTHSTRKLLISVGLWDGLKAHLNSFNKLILLDNVVNRQVLFSLSDLEPSCRDYQSIGWIVQHSDLMEFLIRKLKNHLNIEFYDSTSAANDNDDCLYCFSSEGFNSKIRNTLKIPHFSFLYSQGCITAKILLRGLDIATACEIFTKEGPLAILPLGSNVFQIIWSAPINLCHKRLNYRPSLFLDYLATVLPDGVDPDVLIDQPQFFKTKFLFSFPLSKRDTFLVGDSAHAVHPVGGQGLNLSYRDVSTILQLLKNSKRTNIPNNLIAFKYNLIRLIDISSVCIITDFLTRFFSNSLFILRPLRHLIFLSMRRSLTLRRKVLGQMTFGPH